MKYYLNHERLPVPLRNFNISEHSDIEAVSSMWSRIAEVDMVYWGYYTPSKVFPGRKSNKMIGSGQFDHWVRSFGHETDYVRPAKVYHSEVAFTANAGRRFMWPVDLTGYWQLQPADRAWIGAYLNSSVRRKPRKLFHKPCTTLVLGHIGVCVK